MAARRPATFLTRVLLVLAALIIWFFVLVTSRSSNAQLGKSLFIAIGVLALLFSLLAGVFLTSDCLSEEKREGTLGLLFLTDLKGYDVVLGKLVANSLHAFYGLLAILPLLALPLLIGGVTVGEFWRINLVLVTTISVSLTVGMAVSAFHHETRKAVSTTLLILLIQTGVLPVLWLALRLFPGTPGLNIFLWPSPVFLYSHAFDNYFNLLSTRTDFFVSLFANLSIGVVSLTIASIILPRACEEHASNKAKKSTRPAPSKSQIHKATLRHLWKETLEVNPYYWLAGRQQSHARFARAVIGATLTIWSFFLIGCFLRSRPSQGLSFGVLILIAYGLHMVIKLMLMTEASRRLNEDRRSGALELLLATPLSVPDIIHGQRRALWKSFRSPIGLMLAVNLILFWLVTVADPINLGRERGLFATFFVGGAILLFMDYQALTWTGMWWGLTRAKHTRAILATMLRVMGVPWLILLLGFFVISGGRGSSPSDLTGWYVLWVIGSCVLDGVLARKARSNLFRGLRETLGPAKRIRAQPFTGPLPILLKPGGVT